VIAVLQFDSPDRRLLSRLLAEGCLPSLARLQEAGRFHELESPAARFPAAAYQDLYRGVETGRHGLFYPFQWSAADGRIRLAHSFDAPMPIWERLARAGRRTLAIDPYESHPPRGNAGVLVAGWGIRERVVLGRWSRPRSAWLRLARAHGRPPVVTETFGPHTPPQLDALRARLLEGPARVAAAAADLCRGERFDLVWLTFAASHLAGHRLWTEEGEALAEVYEATDRAIGLTLEALPADADLIVCSPLGMTADASRADLLPGMLAAVLGKGDGGEGARDSGSMWRLRAAVPSGLRAAAAAAVPDRLALEVTARLELRGVDWARTPAFAHPSDNQGYVRLNLAGREREGIVDPVDAEGLLDTVAEGLLTYRDPDGVSVVRGIDRVLHDREGDTEARLPDLVVRWRRAPSHPVVRSARFGEVRRHGSGSGRSGNHTDGDAWALLVPGQSSFADPGRPARLSDVAATIAELTGIPRGDLTGRPLLA
jgi:predicted AlkP superfamily phosphohydrolase/phosphomutase